MKLAAGIILILMSVVHVIYGEKMQVDELKKVKANNMLIASLRVMSLQGGIVVFAVGLVEVLTFAEIIALTGFAAFIPVGIICINVLSVLIISMIKHRELLKATLPQLIIFSVIIILQLWSVL
ncbi:hypothetical protein [Radiobacillus sp. PE A8.2]|uniref:hypothetical protein n=1 Tax=Radiobacillus sp. PE A8.2 TaxID=3380349 RepID=UPI00388F5818